MNPTLTLLDYNIWHDRHRWWRRRHVLLGLVRQLWPDVVAFQEVRHTWYHAPGHNQARWFAQRLGYHYLYRPASMFWPLPPVVEGLAILSRLPVDHWAAYRLPHVRRSGPRRIILHAHIAGFDIYTAHFALNSAGRADNARTLVDVVVRTARGPGVIVGDFNADPWDQPIRYLHAHGFVDLWTRSHPDSSAPPTDPSWSPTRRLDYAFGSGLESYQVHVDLVGTQPDSSGLYPSDHLGLLVTIHAGQGKARLP